VDPVPDPLLQFYVTTVTEIIDLFSRKRNTFDEWKVWEE
jgi:hypothetical protein